MNRPVPECAYCGEPAQRDAVSSGLFGAQVVPVCDQCAAELLELAAVTDGDAR